MKATEQYFPVILFIMLYKAVLNWVCGWNPKVWPLKDVTIQRKATEQYFQVVLFTLLYKVILSFESECELVSSTVLYCWNLWFSLSFDVAIHRNKEINTGVSVNFLPSFCSLCCKSPNAFNCSFTCVTYSTVFSRTMFLLWTQKQFKSQWRWQLLEI